MTNATETQTSRITFVEPNKRDPNRLTIAQIHLAGNCGIPQVAEAFSNLLKLKSKSEPLASKFIAANAGLDFAKQGDAPAQYHYEITRDAGELQVRVAVLLAATSKSKTEYVQLYNGTLEAFLVEYQGFIPS